jgi:kynurenine formamidase
MMHGAGRFGLASLCNLHLLPAAGAVVIAAPLKAIEDRAAGQPAAGDRAWEPRSHRWVHRHAW